MYCKHCGKQIADDSKFCPKCGTSLYSTATSDTSSETSSHDTNATIIYLSNILEMESAKIHLNETLTNVKNGIDTWAKWGNGDDIAKPPLMPSPPIKPNPPTEKTYSFWNHLARIFKNVTSRILFIVFSAFIHFLAIACYSLQFYKAALILFIVYLIFLVSFVLLCHFIFSQYDTNKTSREMENYNHEMEIYNKNMNIYQQCHKNDILNQQIYIESRHKRASEAGRKISSLQSQREKLNNDLKELSTLLNDAYSLNIIPMKFRGILPVYFLHEYMSTSKQSFTNALLHCQLDKLESQLGQIIKSNYLIILQNAVQIAQNKEIIENQQRAESQRDYIINQNEIILNAAIINAKNSEEAAKYSRISAISSATTAFFSTYDHLK